MIDYNQAPPHVKAILFAGPGKCGTSTYSSILRRSKSTCFNLSKSKETNYLLRPKSSVSLQEYFRLFSSTDHDQPFVEVSNLYFFSSHFASNLSLFDSPKIIFTLRHPFDRIVSHLYQYARCRGYVSLDHALDNHLDVISRSLYAYNLDKFIAFKENSLILRLEDLILNAQSTFNKLSLFTGFTDLDFDPPINSYESNSRKSSRFFLASRLLKTASPYARSQFPTLFQSLRDSRFINRLLYRPVSPLPALTPSTIKSLASVIDPDLKRLSLIWGITYRPVLEHIHLSA